MPFLLLFIAFILALASFEMYLEFRQRRKLHEKDVPQLISKLVAKVCLQILRARRLKASVGGESRPSAHGML